MDINTKSEIEREIKIYAIRVKVSYGEYVFVVSAKSIKKAKEIIKSGAYKKIKEDEIVDYRIIKAGKKEEILFFGGMGE